MRPATDRTIRRWSAVGVALAATLVAMLLQQSIRMAWQVRTLPERVMETLLVLVPLDLFERGLQQFGANAKDIALAGAYVGMAALLFVVGFFTVRRLNGWLALLVGLGLWLLAMIIVMPLTGAGLFASGLLVNPLLTDAAYVVIFGAYAVVLALGTGLLTWLDPGRYAAPERTASLERRSLLAGLGGTLVSVLAFGLGRAAVGTGGGVVQSSLPLASAPTRPPVAVTTPTLPEATSTVAASAATGPAATAASTLAPTVAAAQPTATAVAAAFRRQPRCARWPEIRTDHSPPPVGQRAPWLRASPATRTFTSSPRMPSRTRWPTPTPGG